MTREEREKAIDALKISAPIMAITQEEFNDYIQTLNKIMDLLEQEPCIDAISRQAVLDGLANIAKAKARSDAQKSLMGRVMFFTEQLPSISTENPNNCDSISREWLKTAIHNFYYGLKHTPTEEDIQAYIDAAPSVNTEKTGRWKKIKIGDKNFPESIVCSRCGYENSYINEWNFNNEPLSKVFKTSKYCPNCGCRMVKPQESEDEE